MKSLTIGILYFIIFAIIVGCDVVSNDKTTKPKDDNPGVKVLSIDKLRENTLYIIRSVEELPNYLDIEDMPEIDFSEQSLLLAKGRVTYGVSELTNTFYSGSDNNHRIDLYIELNDGMTIDQWQLIKAVPALDYDAKVDFRISINPHGTIEEEDDPNELISTDYFSDCDGHNGMLNTPWDINVPHVIRSIDELSKHFEIEDLPIIDFSKNSLILVKGVASSGIFEITRTFIQEDNGNYIFNVNIHHLQLSTDNMPVWHIVSLVPALGDAAIIELKTVTFYSDKYTD